MEQTSKKTIWAVVILLMQAALSHGEELLIDRQEFQAWLLYPAEKVLKDDPLAANHRTDRIALSAAKGEFEPFLLVLRPKARQSLLDIRFEYGAIKGPADGPSAPLTLEYHRIGYVHVDQPSGTSVFPDVGDRFKGDTIPFGGSGRMGYFPDRLLPEPISTAAPGENTQFWFTLAIQQDAKAGRHKGTIHLKLRGIDPIPIPVEITVFDFALPKAPSLKNTTCWSPQEFGSAWGKEEYKALFRDMALHRQTPDPIVPQPDIQVNKNGTVAVDAKDYDEMLTFCMDDLGLSHFFFPRVGGAWHTNVYFLWQTPTVRKQRWYGAPIFDEALGPTPEFQRAFGDYVRQTVERFHSKGWDKRVYMATMDEPHQAEDFVAVANFGRFVKSVAPNVRIFCTIYPRPELFGAIDCWCPQQYDEAIVRERRAKSEELMFYKNWLHLIDMPMVNPRLYGWIAWRTGAVGWLTYATMGRWDRAWDEPYAVYPNVGIKAWGLGLWWYPDLLKPRILKSVRWEIMREGAEDYEYLALLDKVLRSLSDDRRQSAEAKAAREFLETVADKVILYPGVIPAKMDEPWKTRNCYTTSHRVVWDLRNEAARWIEALSRPQ
ncbi:MAG: glycoside hydrolase domain-containing protein [Planctomycetota bacterium]